MDRRLRKQAERFDRAIGSHFEALYRTAMRLTRCREDAEDLVQDVVLRALPEIDRLLQLQSPRGWLLRVQYHLFVDGVRHRARSPLVPGPLAAGDPDGDPDFAVSEDPGPEQLTEAWCRQRQLAAVWGGLPRKQQALLVLHAEGHSLAELENITGLSRNAISVRLHRARASLAAMIRNAKPVERKLA